MSLPPVAEEPPPPVDDLRREKAGLRLRMRDVRGEISETERKRLGRLVEERLVARPEVQAAGTVMLFSAFGTEVPTLPIARHLAAAGKTVLLPYVEEDEMQPARFRPRERLVATGYGVLEPPRREPHPLEEIEVVVTPGLAFDRTGARIGYGGGHYDRFLARLGPQALRIGICFSQQVVDRVPVGPNDERVDLIVTEQDVIVCAPPRVQM